MVPEAVLEQPKETQDVSVTYARFAPSEPARYRDGLLPD